MTSYPENELPWNVPIRYGIPIGKGRLGGHFHDVGNGLGVIEGYAVRVLQWSWCTGALVVSLHPLPLKGESSKLKLETPKGATSIHLQEANQYRTDMEFPEGVHMYSILDEEGCPSEGCPDSVEELF